jgi:hypothetical protein
MLPNCTSQEQPPLFYYLGVKRGVAALEKYSLAAFYYLGGKRGLGALEKYSLAAFYYLGGAAKLYFSRAVNPLLPPR